MSKDLGRFTLRGGPAVEQDMNELAEKLADAVERSVSNRSLRAFVMMGGYGRGEGGVERRCGQEYPHNNVDVLLILRSLPTTRAGKIASSLGPILRGIGVEHGIGVDFSVIRDTRLRTEPCLVRWYDLRFGHKTLLGDEEFLTSLERFSADSIVPDDMRELLINRGTLLVLNDELRECAREDERARRAVVRHAIKAVIGYGDALLFHLGAYHWSYERKQRVVASHEEIPGSFRRLYQEASEFRFEPDYSRYPDANAFSDSVREELSRVHLQCESQRASLLFHDWSSFVSESLGSARAMPPRTTRGVARRLANLLKPQPIPRGLSRSESFALRAGGDSTRIPAVFPILAYRVADPAARRFARSALGASSIGSGDLRASYLRRWSGRSDANLEHVLGRFGLSLDGAA